jgi:hypothetical protein
MLNPAILQALMQQFMAHGGTLPFEGTAGAAANMEAAEEEEGRSRKYRDGDFELTGALAGMPQSILALPNPAVPLKFEQPPGKWRGAQPQQQQRGYVRRSSMRVRLPRQQMAYAAAARTVCASPHLPACLVCRPCAVLCRAVSSAGRHHNGIKQHEHLH